MPDAGDHTNLYIGFLDSLAEDGVVGWVVNLFRPAVPVMVDMVVDGVRVATTRADIERLDVRDAGMTATHVGFRFQMPAELCRGQRHKVSFRSETGQVLALDDSERLGGDTWEFCCAQPAAAGPAGADAMPDAGLCRYIRGNLDSITANGITGWAIHPGGSGPVELDMLIDGMPVAHVSCTRARPDVKASGEARSEVGFAIDIPDRFHDGLSHVLQLQTTLGEAVRLGDGSGGLQHQWRFSFPRIGLRGQVDGFTDGCVRGWVFACATGAAPNPAGLRILVRYLGQPLAQIRCDLFRADVAERYGCDPNCGFSFVPPADLVSADVAEFHFSVLGHERFVLANSPIRVDMPRGGLVTRLQSMQETIDALFAQTWHLRQQLRALLPAPPHTLHSYHEWAVAYLDRLAADTALLPFDEDALGGPLVSVICPTFRPRLPDFLAAVASVQAQTYGRWELIIVDDASGDADLRAAIVRLAQADRRIRWRMLEHNAGISAATNVALDLAEGAYVAFFDHDDLLVPQALQIMVAAAERTGARVLYSDEDKIDDDGRYSEVHFKPAWNHRLLLSQNYICHLLFVERRHLLRVGRLDSAYDGAQDHDLVLRLSEITDAGSIVHVPEVLYHWRKTPTSTASSGASKSYAVSAGCRAIGDHLARMGHAAEVGSLMGATLYAVAWRFAQTPKVSILIPYREQIAMTRGCVEAILAHTDYADYEIVLIDNFSVSDQALAFAAEYAATGRVRVVRVEERFNYSRLNNVAVAGTDAPLLVFMNNDVVVRDAGWLRVLVDEALADPRVGVVGGKLLYPSGHVQHGGVVLGVGGIADHAHRGLPAEHGGYMARAITAHEVSAVTAALMLCRRSAFEQVGGFDAHDLPVAFNDIDLCLKIGAAASPDGGGTWRVIMAPGCVAEHHESLSRGSDLAAERQVQFFHENHVMADRWKDVLANDRFYSPHFSRRGGIYRDLAPVGGLRAPR